MEASLTQEEFSQHANSKFQVLIDQDNSVELELTQVSELKIYPEQEEFAVVFRGPLNAFLGQGTRTFKHDRMGEFVIFIVPIAQDAQGFEYEAVFNRVRDQQTK
jgi:hypothetical protein